MKIDKKLILMIVLVLVVVGVLGGCSNKKVPEGVSQQFYDDMVASSSDLVKVIKNAKNVDIFDSDIFKGSGYDIIVNYLYGEDDLTLTLIEFSILEALHDIYTHSAMYYNDKVLYGSDSDYIKDKLKDEVTTFSKLMDIDFDIDKIILK